jgi:rod shape-determining protein MreB
MKDFWSKEMAMDLGTANTLIYVRGKGVVADEPSVVAFEPDSGKVIAVGREARSLAGRQGRKIQTSRPLRDGVIRDFEMAAFMIRSLLGNVFKKLPLSKPRLIVAVPSGITSVEKRAVIEAAEMAGVGKVRLVEEPMAAAIGTGLAVERPEGHMVVDIGGGTTEVAVISRFTISYSESLRVAGDEANEAVLRYIRDEHKLGVSETMAEVVKMKIGSAVPLSKKLEVKLRGKDLMTGMPKTISITDDQIREVLRDTTRVVVDAVRRVLEKSPPALASDVAEHGIWLAGGGALLKGLKLLIQQSIGVETYISEDPLRSVIRGVGAITEKPDFYEGVFLN